MDSPYPDLRRPRGEDWLQRVQEPASDWSRLQESLQRGRPFGGDAWIAITAKKLDLEATPRPVARPRKPDAEKTEVMSPLFEQGDQGRLLFSGYNEPEKVSVKTART